VKTQELPECGFEPTALKRRISVGYMCIMGRMLLGHALSHVEQTGMMLVHSTYDSSTLFP
jgi:hypothetical protein